MNIKILGVLISILLIITGVTTTALQKEQEKIIIEITQDEPLNIICNNEYETAWIHQELTQNNSPPNTPDQLTGPSTGYLYQTLSYLTSATDPDGDPMKIGIDFHNDGIVDRWTEFYIPSGAFLQIDITFTYIGTFHITVKAKDIHDAESGWAPPKTVVITEAETNPPSTPSTPIGPISGLIETLYSFSTSSVDADGDQIQYGFDWNGNGAVDEWSSFFDSGDMCTLSHSWSEAGIYNIKVKARDDNDFESDWSPPLNITITDFNTPPAKPSTPSGPPFGRTERSYSFSTSTIDPEGDNVYYKWNWGDDESDWDGPYASGSVVSTSHIWSDQGSFVVKVKAKDDNDAESVWSDPFSVTMPKFKGFYSLIYRYLENNPYLNQLLCQLLNKL
jgi:hypothetical protein